MGQAVIPPVAQRTEDAGADGGGGAGGLPVGSSSNGGGVGVAGAGGDSTYESAQEEEGAEAEVSLGWVVLFVLFCFADREHLLSVERGPWASC